MEGGSQANSTGQTKPAQHLDVPPGEIELPPAKAHAGTTGVGVMVVMPALTEGEQGHPPVIAGAITAPMAHVAPPMGG